MTEGLRAAFAARSGAERVGVFSGCSPPPACCSTPSPNERQRSSSVDDFGTGYSSLAYLKRLPVHEIKIDKSFVMDLAEDTSRSDAAIVRSVVDLGRHLGLRVVAEGVSDRVASDLLTEMGGEQAQGFWFARPVAAGAVEELMAVGVHGFTAVRHDDAVVPFVRRRRAGTG